MKRRPVIWADEALDDLAGIVAYISADNPVAARSVIDRIEKAGNNLEHMAIGHFGRVDATYEIGISNLPYIIAYSIDPLPEGSEAIMILRIIHGARNWPEGEWPT